MRARTWRAASRKVGLWLLLLLLLLVLCVLVLILILLLAVLVLALSASDDCVAVTDPGSSPPLVLSDKDDSSSFNKPKIDLEKLCNVRDGLFVVVVEDEAGMVVAVLLLAGDAAGAADGGFLVLLLLVLHGTSKLASAKQSS